MSSHILVYGKNSTSNEIELLQSDNVAAAAAGDLSGRTTITDDSTSTFLKCDATGKLEVSSAASDLSGRTTIADDTTSTFLKCDASGKLEATISALTDETQKCISMGDNAGTATDINVDANGNQKCVIMGDNSGTATDLSVDGNGKLNIIASQLPLSLGQKANSGSISICRSTTAGSFDLSARTTIGTASTTTNLKCDATGHLLVSTEPNKEYDVITDDSAGTALIGSLGSTTFTESIDMTNFRSFTILIDSASFDSLQLWACNTTNGTFVLLDEMYAGGGNGGIHFTFRECPPKFLRIYNQNSTTYTFTSIEVFKMD